MATRTIRKATAITAATENAGSLVELGKTGLKQWSGIIDEEFYPELRGWRGIKIYREMRELDPVIGAMAFALESSFKTATISVEAGGATTEDRKARDLIETSLQDMSATWSDTIGEIMTCFWYGWSFHELVYKKRNGDSGTPGQSSRYNDGLIGWRKWPIRAQETTQRWLFDDEGGIQGMVQQPPDASGLITIPIDKALLFRTGSHKNNPQGRSLLKNAYLPYYFGKRIQIVEGQGIARDLVGFPIMYAPGDVTSASATGDKAATREALKKMVTRIHRDEQEGALLPGSRDANGNRLFELVLLASGGQRQFDTSKVLERYDTRKAIVMLMDFILVGHQQTGSFSMHADKTKLFTLAIGAHLDGILETINRHAIPRLLALNGIKVKTPPKLTRGELDRPDLAAIGTYVQAVTTAGMPLFPDQATENYLRGVAKLPLLVDGATVAKRDDGQVLFAQAASELLEFIQEAKRQAQ